MCEIFKKSIKNLKFIVFSLCITFFVAGCKNHNKKTISEYSISGSLIHTQYWNKFDRWDMSGLMINIVFSDGTQETLSGNSPQMDYTFNYSSPAGLEPGTYELVIDESYYVPNSKTKIAMGSKNLGEVNVINYPYKNSIQGFLNSNIAVYVIFPTIAVVLIVSFLVLHFIFKRKNKEEKK